MIDVNTLKNILIRQKDEIPRLLAKPFTKRHSYVQAQKLMPLESIKVIIGPRRAGKSTFAINLIQAYDFIYINFDELELSELTSHSTLDDALESVYGKNPRHIFVDEIQNLYKFELWLNSLQRRGYNVLATGSNANLLSSELSTHLTGRYAEIEILPFSYKEYGGDFNRFYNLGGFPEILLNGQDKESYATILQDSIILKDVVKRYNIRHYDKILSIYNYLSSTVASLFSYKNIAEAVKLKSEHTVRKYIQYLGNTYLHYELLPFSQKTKEFYRSNKKSYVVDNAFIRNNSLSPNSSKFLENFVFTELIKSRLKPNKNLFYYKSVRGFEVDFLVKKDLQVHMAIQVCYEFTNLETRERELRALVDVYKEFGVTQLYVVTMNHREDVVVQGVQVKVLPAVDFLQDVLYG